MKSRSSRVYEALSLGWEDLAGASSTEMAFA